MTTVTMVFGRIGAGKTTLARRRESEDSAVRLSLDEWTIAATGDRVHVDREVVDRVTDQLMALWPSIVDAGVPVVLDFGFWSRGRRDQVRDLAARCGAEVRLIWVRCAEGERRRRCAERSADADDTYVIDDGGFDWIEANRLIEEPSSDEEPIVVDTTS